MAFVQINAEYAYGIQHWLGNRIYRGVHIFLDFTVNAVYIWIKRNH